MWNLAYLLSYLVLAVIITFIAIPPYIRLLKYFRMGKEIREEALMGQATEFHKLHEHKTWTPNMWAGVLLLVIFFLVSASLVVWYLAPKYGWKVNYSLLNRKETWLVLFTFLTMGIIGGVDDFLNVRKIGRTKWLPAKLKMWLLILFSALGAWWFYGKLWYDSVNLPWIGSVFIGWLYIPLFIFTMISMANAVNITDGLDGLAGGLLLFNYAVYAYICYSKWLLLLAAICLLVVGTLIAFLWYNIKPAQFYMWDIGSLAFGAGLAVMAMMTDTLIVLLIISAIYILEVVSSGLQVLSKKFRNGKKIFKIAPFHHHLEALGWKEESIVMRFWLIGMVLSTIGLIVNMFLK